MKAKNSLALCLAAVLCGATEASEPKPLEFTAANLNLRDEAFLGGWFINPVPLAESDTPIKRFQPLISTKMFPYKAYKLNDRLKIENPEYVATPGTELVGVIAHVSIGCTPKHVAQTASQKLILRTGTVHLCFVDTDKNGSFDKYFTTKRGLAIGEIPPDAQSMTPISFTEIDPKSSALTTNFWLYLRKAKGNDVEIGYLEDKNDRTQSGLISIDENEALFYRIKAKTLPTTIRLFGISYKIDEIGENVAKISSVSHSAIAPITLGESCCR